MAFKPIAVTKEIDGVEYTAQFNGAMAMYRATDAEGGNAGLVEYLFNNVIVEPKITDVDEYFGVNVETMGKVVEFAGKVMRADPEYFPPANESATAKKR